MMLVTRFTGTSICRASSAAEILSSFNSSARCSPGCIGVRATLCLLVVIDNFDIYRPGRAIGPLKADSPLVVDTEAALTLPSALQCYKPVAGQSGEIFQARRRFQAL